MGKRFKKDVSAGVSMIIDNYSQIDRYLVSDGNVYVEERTLEEARQKNENLNHPVQRLEERNTAVLDLLAPEMLLR